MPQLIVTDFAPQIVWLVITFAALYLVMAKVALPRIAIVLEERQDRIADDLEQAETYRNDTEAALKAYEAALAEARAGAHEIAQAMRDELAAEAARRKAEVEAELAKQLAAAEGDIRAMREAALANVEVVATEAAAAATARLLGVEIDEAAVAAAIKKAAGDG